MDDEVLARKLQEEYDREAAASLLEEDEPRLTMKNKPVMTNRTATSDFSKSSNLSPVDPSLEFSDPSPDIRILFLHFNEEYFYGKLSGIEVKWSPRMTLCAGLCVYEGRGGLCSVRLSQPLLKLRPRKDLVETLLHEMIHAYLFITNNDRDHDGHGPNFQNHMRRINSATGANISIYHTFHDEVASYQQHWWRCNGPCQHRRPYFGYVKRAMNRAPSSNDTWWAEHRATCGGTYTKIREPEDYGKKKPGVKKNQDKNSEKDIRAFLGKGHPLSKNSKNDHSLFQITGKSSSSNSKGEIGVGGSIPSKTNTRDKNFSRSDIPSTSRHIVSGGHLIPKASLNRSSLFSSVGASNSAVSHSTPLKKQKRIEDFNDNIPKTKRHFLENGEKNTQNRANRNFSYPDQTPNSNEKHKLPKTFHSVCEEAHKKDSGKGKRKKKYIFDELDDDDGLWDSMGNSSDLKDNKAKIFNQGSDVEPSASPLSHTLRDLCKIEKHETSTLKSLVKRDILDEMDSAKSNKGILSSKRESSSSISNKFPGQGYKLGGQISFKKEKTDKLPSTPFSVERKCNIKEEVSNSSSTQKGQGVSDTKRSFHSAFSSVIDISDSDSERECGETLDPPSKMLREDCLNRDFPPNSQKPSVLGSTSTSPSSGPRTDSGDSVSCPVCSTKVFHTSINTHLDTCLQMA